MESGKKNKTVNMPNSIDWRPLKSLKAYIKAGLAAAMYSTIYKTQLSTFKELRIPTFL